MKLSIILWFMLIAALLAGCGSQPQRPAPVESRTEVKPPPKLAGRYQPAEVIAYRAPPQPGYSRPEPAKAVKALLQRAEAQQKAGELVAAASTLERALRIEPKNAQLWNRLAHVRFDQQRYQLAVSLAAKSNAFAGGDAKLKADNDALIRRARAGN